MPVEKLILRPGVNADATPMLNEGQWSLSQFVRFFQGYLQKLGGWVRLTSNALLGTARAMLAWEDFSSNQYLILGTEKALDLYFSGLIYNITPITSTDTVTPSFSTVASSTTVKVTETAHAADVGNYVTIENPISVGGIVLQGPYEITNVIDANNYDIVVPVAATSTVNNAGAAALFNTTNLSSTVTVTLNNHGLSVGQTYTVYVSTTVGGITLFGTYSALTVPDANTLTISATPASATTSGSENGGDVTFQYLLPSGARDSQGISGIYGAGDYGSGIYSVGATNAFKQARLWSFGYWGTDVVASYTNGSIYTWISENGLLDNPATLIATAPANISANIFTATPQQQVVALGASYGTSTDTDQMLVRWSSVADNTDWTASVTNQAGSFRIPRGARIVGGIQGPQTGLIWTDVGLWLMQYIGYPLVYGFIEIGQGCGLIGQNARGVLAGKVYWMSYNGFFVYDGNSVQALPCPVWDKVFKNLNQFQAAKVIACPNSFFNEMSWCYPSLDGDGENDARVTFNAIENVWTFDPPGALVRTAWLDQSALLNPLGVDGDALIQQHENGSDADGQAMVSYAQSGFMKIASGQEYTFLERMIPDAILENDATLNFTFFFQNYPNGPVRTIGPLSYTAAKKWLIIRGRGRLVSVKVGSSDLGTFWRLGECLNFGQSAGRR